MPNGSDLVPAMSVQGKHKLSICIIRSIPAQRKLETTPALDQRN